MGSAAVTVNTWASGLAGRRIKLLEEVVRRGDLALRCRDVVRGSVVDAGLRVEAWQDPASGALNPRFRASRSPVSGVYGLYGLPGLGEFENGLRPATDFCNGGSPPNFAIEVTDEWGRFLPQVLQLCLPKEAVVETPLFSSPGRATPSGLGAIRGEVWDWAAQGPARWAVVQVALAGGPPLVTVADDRGMFALFVPYAAALPALAGDPPRGTGNLGEIEWDAELSVLYAPATQRRVSGSDVPQIRSILEQGAATVYGAFDAPGGPGPAGPRLPGPSLPASLRFGVELVVKTPGSARVIVAAV